MLNITYKSNQILNYLRKLVWLHFKSNLFKEKINLITVQCILQNEVTFSHKSHVRDKRDWKPNGNFHFHYVFESFHNKYNQRWLSNKNILLISLLVTTSI